MPPPSAASFEDAVALRDHGDPTAAAEALTAIAKKGGEQWAAAAYELALLEHGRGRHWEADEWLRRLGFRHRLSDAVFHPPRTEADGGSGRICKGATPLRVVDGALSPSLFSAVKGLFASDTTTFWRDHDYPTPSFFSYNAPIKRKKRKRADGGDEGVPGGVAPGGSLLRAVAQSLLAVAEVTSCHEGVGVNESGSGVTVRACRGMKFSSLSTCVCVYVCVPGTLRVRRGKHQIL